MLKVAQIRCGNRLLYNGQPISVYSVSLDYDGVIWYAEDNAARIEKFAPIPLTPDLLEKCNKEQLHRLKPFFVVVMNANKDKWWFGIEATQRKIEYLHEFQNVVFAFLDEELEINIDA